MPSSAPNEQSAAVFLDRDGTIMRDAEYCGDPADVAVFAGASAALRDLKTAGFRIVIITNQSGIGRGYFSELDYRAVESEVERQLGPGLIDATYFCPDLPDDGSKRRKPEIGMILEAQREHALDLGRSFLVGDKLSDLECGRRAGVRTIFVHTGNEKPAAPTGADWEARDLTEAASFILRHAN